MSGRLAGEFESSHGDLPRGFSRFVWRDGIRKDRR